VKRIYPKLTLLERPFHLLGKGVYLKGLVMLSRQFKDRLRSERRNGPVSLTQNYLEENRFREIAAAFRMKGIPSLNFSLKDGTLLPDDSARRSLIVRAIRIATREVVTHGLTNVEKSCIIKARSAESENLQAELIIEPPANDGAINVIIKISYTA